MSDRKHKLRVPRCWLVSWNRLMSPHKDWESLSPPVCLSACLSFHMIAQCYEKHRERTIGSTWWTRLCRPLSVWRHIIGRETTVVMGTGNLAAVGVVVKPRGDGKFSLKDVFPA